MIKMIRLDDRRIHGQVAIAWLKQLGTKTLIVCSDSDAASKTASTALKMAGPPGCKTLVYTLEKTISALQDPRAANLDLSIIAVDLKSIYEICKAVPNLVERVNFGNYGRLNMKPGEKLTDKIQLSDNVHITQQERALLKELLDLGIKMDAQLLPYTQMVDVVQKIK